MSLHDILEKKKAAIVDRWFHLILDTYPPDTSKFLRRRKDRFANPVGHTISEGVRTLYEELLQGVDPVRVSPMLDQIIRVRAIQDFSPSGAISFVLSLKNVIREELKGELQDARLSTELMEVESRIDDLILLSFDIYVKCREKVYELRANEARNRTYKLLERANLVGETQDDEQSPGGVGGST